MKFNAAVLAVASMLSFGTAQAALINFEAEAQGGKPNGYSPAGHPGVTFTDTAGANLAVANTPIETGGTNALAVFTDFDGSALRIDFATAQTSLSMAFGNDDAAFVGGPVFALLELFDGATLVASTLLATNNNDVMDQTISANFAGGFNNARFTYTNGAGAPINLIEVVDNIEYLAVPNPGSLALAGLAMFGLGVARRRRG